MNSLLSSDASSFNPDKFTASQSYVSTNSWSSPYAGKPTGYSGMFLKEDKSKQNSGPTGGQKPKQELHGMQQQMSQTQYNAKMNFVPTNMMLPGGAPIDSSDLKFSFDPDKINQFFGTFRPGQIAPSVNGPKAESSERNEEKSDKPKDDKENEESHDDKEAKSERKSGAHAQQEQTQSHQSQIMPFNTNQGSFAQLDPLPKYFMGNFGGSNPFYFHNNDEQVSQEPEYESFEFVPGRMVPSRQKRSGKEEGRSKKISAENVMRALMANMKFFEKFFRHDVANQEQVEEKKSQVPVNRDSRQNLTIVNSTMTTVQPTTTTAQVTTTLPSSTTITVITNVTSTNNTSTKIKVNPTKQQSSSSGGFNPDAVNAGQAQQGGAPVSMFAYGNPSGFNPNSANKNTGFNPAMSPGMTATAFSGMQFGQLGPRLANSSSKMDPFGMNMNANFDPSKFNSIHMNFDMNSQLGIMGNPNGSPSGSQAFSGGYDPMKTNLMALQNPFTPGSANGNSSKTGMNQYGGGNNAFMKPFNPNALNEALFGKIENGPSNSTNGGSDADFSSFYLGMGGGSGFGGSFDPSRVNNAVFNPDEVNKIRIHFDPSEMLERNPGYDKNVASTYNFDPNKVNQMQGQNVVPPFLGQNQGQSTPGSTDNKTKADSFGQPSEFHPGMLSGGGNQGIKFDPNKYNNITLQMNPMSQTNQIQSLINPANNSLSFDPTAVNNMQMNYNPYQMIGGNNLDHQLSTPGNNNQAPPSGQVQEFNTNHALPVNNVPTLQGGNKDDSA
ncbi:hypothetical protein FSP39_015528 [Pinctada imbricata]|uniref:Uncharacterized protein n=1 Tax=Pinctada imbricata TaxID=66713 RepID=A0AA88XSL4_PINIB|nr:hypothetical protein FSP39_015528 [Pinctada imbricata]